MSVDRRRAMIGAVHTDPSIPPKWRRLSIRSSFFHAPQPEPDPRPSFFSAKYHPSAVQANIKKLDYFLSNRPGH
jgi:hypothetical protein